ncbi:MAG: transmembrane anchor protein [Oceanospirillaceae bacterium]|nr:transmembrane anchor protein [Oceanospirillaceae bacterium]
MYNSEVPNKDQLPSSKQLLVSTLAAFVVAMILLITVILPAEYAIDPTGIGRGLGLTEMGEIKTSLEAEAEADKAKPAQQSALAATPQTTPQTVQQAAQPTNSTAQPQQQVAKAAPAAASEPAKPAVKQDKRVLTLAPGQAAELKLGMNKGDKVQYRWIAEGGKLNFDTHGDNAEISYHGYGKGRNKPGQEGELVAAFDGNHGWFWRNRSDTVVTLTLEVQGDFLGLMRVM